MAKHEQSAAPLPEAHWEHLPRASGARAIPVVDEHMDSKDLFAGARVVTISHGSQLYQLRLTSQNKLILTK